MSKYKRVISGEGAQHEAPAAVREFAVLFEDGELWVAESKVLDAHYLSYRGQIKRRGVKFVERTVSFSDVQRAYAAQHTDTDADAEGDANSQQQEAVMNWLNEAKKLGATDIQLKVSLERAEVRYRILGSLETRFDMKADRGRQMIRTICDSMSDGGDQNYDPTRDQNGRIKAEFTPEGLHQTRVATGPVVDGAFLTLRLHPDHGRTKSLVELGYHEEQAKTFDAVGKLPAGIFTLSGPTGCGKTTTLNNFMRARMAETGYTRNLVDIGDPVEIPIPGSVPKNVERRGGDAEDEARAWAETIDTVMRWDTDWMIIGEMRLRATMHAALKASLTSHLVFSTIHANDANVVMDRLREGGIDIGYLTDPSIYVGFSNQSLVPTLCSHCSTPLVGSGLDTPDVMNRLGTSCTLTNVRVRGPGCDHCRNGVVSRTVVAEVIRTDDEFMRHYRASGSRGARRYWAVDQGGMTKCQHLALKVSAGLVDPFDGELLAVPLDHDFQTLGITRNAQPA